MTSQLYIVTPSTQRPQENTRGRRSEGEREEKKYNAPAGVVLKSSLDTAKHVRTYIYSIAISEVLHEHYSAHAIRVLCGISGHRALPDSWLYRDVMDAFDLNA